MQTLGLLTGRGKKVTVLKQSQYKPEYKMGPEERERGKNQ